MPTCETYKCTNTTRRTAKGKSFFKIRESKNATERKRAQQWLHKMGMGQDIKHLNLSEIQFYVKTIFIKIVLKRI